MMLDYENGIRGRITRANCHYTKANSKYMCDYDEVIESAYIQYLHFFQAVWQDLLAISSFWKI